MTHSQSIRKPSLKERRGLEWVRKVALADFEELMPQDVTKAERANIDAALDWLREVLR